MGIFGETPPVSIVGFILTILLFIIHLIGFASPVWNYKSNVGFTEYYGLWQRCVSGDKHTNCTSLTCDDGMDNPWCTKAWETIRMLEILGPSFLFIAIVLVSLHMFKFKDKTILKLAGICCTFFGGVVILIGVILYGTQEGIDNNSFHFAFVCCILSAVGSVLAAVLLIIGHALARTTESERMYRGLPLNTIEQNDESDGISESTLQESKANIEILNIWGNEPVQLAVTGKSGLGKSSFINAFRNLKPGDPGFATRNTTKHATVYKYPGNPKITLHDLPGFGSTKWPINKYGDNMELHKYDYVLIFFGNIEDNDIKIAKKLKEMKKPFCFVRSKIDIDFENPKNEGKPKAEAIKKIMSKSSDILGQKGLKEARIFALSIRNGMSGHFDELVLCIQHNLSKSKSNAVNMSMGGVLSIELIDNKYEILKERIWKVSLETAGLATVPVPGLSVLLNSALICNELWLYHKTFGFEQQTVKEISKDDCISQNLASSSIVKIDAAKEAIQQFISIQLETRGTLKAAQSVVGPFVPIIGPVVSGLTTYGATYILLNRVLDGCRDDAKLVYYHLRNSDFHKESKKAREDASPNNNYVCCRCCRS